MSDLISYFDTKIQTLQYINDGLRAEMVHYSDPIRAKYIELIAFYTPILNKLKNINGDKVEEENDEYISELDEGDYERVARENVEAL